MDVLNSIWSLLTTENEMLTKIVTAPTVVIEAWLLFKLSTSILKIKYTKTQKVIYICLLSLNSLLTEFIIPSPYNFFVNYLIIYIVIKFTFHLNLLKNILAIIMPTALFVIVGNLLLNPVLKLLNITSMQLTNCILYRCIYLIFLYTSIYIIALIFNKRSIHLTMLNNLNKKSHQLILLNIILGSIIIIIQLVITFYNINNYSLVFSLLNFISLLTYFVISFYSLKRIINLQIAEVELENSESYNKTLSFLYDNVKAFKHDFDNIVFTIGGFINTNDIDGLRIYYQSLEKECQNINNIALLNPTLINNPGIYNLLTTKYKTAKDEGVEIQLDFFFDLNKLHMPIYDFSRMFGIFLDNAIEAASTSNEKIIKISFRDSSKSHIQVIKIENSYSNKNIDKLYSKKVSRKKINI